MAKTTQSKRYFGLHRRDPRSPNESQRSPSLNNTNHLPEPPRIDKRKASVSPRRSSKKLKAHPTNDPIVSTIATASLSSSSDGAKRSEKKHDDALRALPENSTASAMQTSLIYAKLETATIRAALSAAGSTATPESQQPLVDPATQQFLPTFVETIVSTTHTQKLHKALNTSVPVPPPPPAVTPTSTLKKQQRKKTTFVSRMIGTNTYISKVKGKVLLLDKATDNAKDQWTKEQSKIVGRSRRKLMNAKERKEKGVFDIPKDLQKYELYVPLHQLWAQYMEEMIGNVTDPSTLLPKLVKADLHGCKLTVVRSKCPTYVGQSGILLKETENMFELIGNDNKLRSIPKMNSVFTFQIKGQLVTLYGNQFCTRSSERISKKFKSKPTVEL
ncbi:hypothetical protein BJ742DRAFT_481 [Cladochytrium replicatum]|nr:hypothetical protein BJ742DRAFT_481 [Cladochytrium replicatum]